MYAKNHLLIFSSFLDIWENVEWPRFFGPPGMSYIFVADSTGLSSFRLSWWAPNDARVLKSSA